MMKKTDMASSPGEVLGFPVLFGFLTVLVLLAACAAVVLAGAVGDNLIVPMAFAVLGVGCFCAAFLAARRATGNRLLWAFVAGSILFACLVVLSLAWVGQPVAPLRLAVNAVIALATSCFGGMLGAGLRKKTRRKRSR